ncbi:hypothetical protein MKY66_22415 [Paenibacillus sp. FSL R5-0766]
MRTTQPYEGKDPALTPVAEGARGIQCSSITIDLGCEEIGCKVVGAG